MVDPTVNPANSPYTANSIKKHADTLSNNADKITTTRRVLRKCSSGRNNDLESNEPMETVTTSLITFAALFGGALFGMFLHSRLPEHHMNEDSKRIVNLGAGIIGTMAALVLGLLVASAKGNYDARNNEVLDATAKIALLDRMLAQYGPDARPTRDQLHQSVERAVDRLWPHDSSAPGTLGHESRGVDTLLVMISSLPGTTELQRTMKAQALSIAMNLGQTRWLMTAQEESSVSKPLLVIVVFWLAINFMSFGLFAPRNATVIVTLSLCAVAVAGAIFLVLEMYNPFGGLLHISGAPIRDVLAQMDK